MEKLGMKKLKLNLGCGRDYINGFINIDKNLNHKADLYFNLNNYPYPFDSNSIDFIRCWNTMEHLDNLVNFLEEIYRILKKGGKFKFRVPLAFTVVDSRDPTHKQHITPSTFDVFFRGYKSYELTDIRFNGKVWITIPKLHLIKFNKNLYYLNSLINNLFTGVEGELIK